MKNKVDTTDKILSEYITERELLELDIDTLKKLSHERELKGEKQK